MTMTDEQVQRLSEMDEQTKRQDALAETLDPGLPYITRFIMAGDLLSAERSKAKVESGEWEADKALVLTGSYARLDLAMQFVEEGRLSKQALLAQLPELWRGSDPDDTDERFLRLWFEAWRTNGKHPVYDGRPLPRRKVLAIYRGQMPNDPKGIAWTLDPKIANKFANGAGIRMSTMPGVVFRGYVQRHQVFAYLTGRGEQEVICNPAYIKAEP